MVQKLGCCISTNGNTQIAMQQLAIGIYILKVNQHNQELKSLNNKNSPKKTTHNCNYLMRYCNHFYTSTQKD
jgi:hypothetical protein